MFDRRQLAAFRNTLQVAANDLTGPEAARLLHQTARDERARVLREQAARSGVTPTDLVIADGQRDAPIETAERLVIIEYGYLREVASETLRALVARSPKRTGRYARSFEVLVGGRVISDIGSIQHETAELYIVNTQPYARRLEVGKQRDGSPFVVQVQPRIVESVAIEVARRFGNVAEIRFTYVDLAGAPVVAVRRRRRTVREPVRYPAIRVTAR